MADSTALVGQNIEHENEINLSELPVSCISAILSFTSPRDVCRLSAVSTRFRSAADSDSIWNKFLPPKCYQILPRTVIPVQFATRKELYFRFRDSILIDEGRKIFWLDPSTAKLGYMVSARELTIEWGEDQRYWRWVSREDSRFEEVAELLKVCWLEVRGGIDCRLLSSDTEYRVLFLLKFGERSRGWNALPIKFSVKMPGQEEMEIEHIFPLERQGAIHRRNSGGWMEVVAGEFEVRATEDNSDGESSHIEFHMKEVQSNWWKRGVVLDGVKIEPKYT